MGGREVGRREGGDSGVTAPLRQPLANSRLSIKNYYRRQQKKFVSAFKSPVYNPIKMKLE